MEKPAIKKVTILIPEELWLRARRRALEERTNLRALVLQGLAMRIGSQAKAKAMAKLTALVVKLRAMPPMEFTPGALSETRRKEWEKERGETKRQIEALDKKLSKMGIDR